MEGSERVYLYCHSTTVPCGRRGVLNMAGRPTQPSGQSSWSVLNSRCNVYATSVASAVIVDSIVLYWPHTAVTSAVLTAPAPSSRDATVRPLRQSISKRNPWPRRKLPCLQPSGLPDDRPMPGEPKSRIAVSFRSPPHTFRGSTKTRTKPTPSRPTRFFSLCLLAAKTVRSKQRKCMTTTMVRVDDLGNDFGDDYNVGYVGRDLCISRIKRK